MKISHRTPKANPNLDDEIRREFAALRIAHGIACRELTELKELKVQLEAQLEERTQEEPEEEPASE